MRASPVGMRLFKRPAVAAAPSSTTWGTHADYTLTGSNLTAERTGTSTFWGYEHSSVARANGTADFTINVMGSAAIEYVGLDNGTEASSPGDTQSIFWRQDGALIYGGAVIATLATWTAADQLRIVKAAGNVSFYKWNGSSWVQQGSTIDTTSVTYGLGSIMVGACYASLASQNATGFKVTANFTSF